MKLTKMMIMVLTTVAMTMGQIPTNGLVAWFPFNGNFNDESGTGIVLTHTSKGAPVLTTDRDGTANKAYAFDGTILAFKGVDDSKLPKNNFTICAWIFNNKGNGPNCLVNWGTESLGKKISFFKTNDIHFNYLCITNGTDTIKEKIPISSAKPAWNHVAVTVSGTETKLFFNGQLIKTGSISFNIELGGFLGIGTDWLNPAAGIGFFGGNLDDIAIYNRALSTQEISYTYTCKSAKNSAPTFTSTPMLLGKVNVQYRYTVSTNDIDGQTVTTNLTQKPIGMSISGNQITWTPMPGQEGVNQVTIVAKDALGDSAIQNFSIKVEGTVSNIQPITTPKFNAIQNVTKLYLPNGKLISSIKGRGLVVGERIRHIIVK